MAASVNSAMPKLRILMVVLLGLLALAPAAGAAGTNQILRDCEDDSRLSGDYSTGDLRKARNNINSGLDAYSDCRDVLSAAIAAKSRKASGGDTGSIGGPGSGGGAAGGGGGGGTGGTATPGRLLETDLGAAPPEVSAEERSELRKARETAPQVELRGQRVDQGVEGVAGAAAASTLPTPLILALAALAAALVLAGVVLVRRRVLARRAA